MSDSKEPDEYELPPELGGGTYTDNFSTVSGNRKEHTFWRRHRNVLLVGAGTLLFGGVIADRLINTYSADEIPDIVEIQRDIRVPGPVVVDDEQNLTVQAPVALDPIATLVAPEPKILVIDSSVSAYKEPLDIDTLFGSRLVFVSASKPQYVITEDDKRFDLGSAIDDQTTLAGVTSEQLVLEQDGDFLVLGLPDPSVQ